MKDSVELQKKNHHSWFEWAQLFIYLSIPVVIIIYTVIQNNNDISIAEKNRRQDLEIDERRHKQDIELAEQRRQQDIFLAAEQQEEDILLNYFNSLGKLLEKHGVNLNETAVGRRIGRFTTLAALNQLNSKRKTLVIVSLIENTLLTIQKDRYPTISLSSANLTGLNLTGKFQLSKQIECVSLDATILTNASFQDAQFWSWSFKNSYLINSDFSSSNGLSIACLDGSSLYSVNFADSTLDGANAFSRVFHLSTSVCNLSLPGNFTRPTKTSCTSAASISNIGNK
ncbi:unnamed protein product [Rotaria sp. Silwood1]|nr:unnamed protein product [Rotaria sp. Silwood1]